MALKGVVVVELAGLAPGPFCGKLLRDFGAEVVHIARTESDFIDVFSAGKQSIQIDLKRPLHKEIFLHIVDRSDVLIDPYRPGVLERLGLGPAVLMQRNPKLIIARLSGWGHTGPLASSPGHDLNYLAMTGVLSTFSKSPTDTPYPPHNLLADMAGGGLMCTFGILLALIERSKSGKGQIIDSAMVDGVIYLSAFVFHMKALGLWGYPVGQNLLDTGAFFYNIYRCADGKDVAVGCLEPRFYKAFLKALWPYISTEHRETIDRTEQYDNSQWPSMKSLFSSIFSTKSRDQWVQIFSGTEACVSPVLTLLEAAQHPLNQQRGNFSPTVSDSYPYVPQAAPKLSKTPGSTAGVELVAVGKDSQQVMRRFGVPEEVVKAYKKAEPRL